MTSLRGVTHAHDQSSLQSLSRGGKDFQNSRLKQSEKYSALAANEKETAEYESQ